MALTPALAPTLTLTMALTRALVPDLYLGRVAHVDRVDGLEDEGDPLGEGRQVALHHLARVRVRVDDVRFVREELAEEQRRLLEHVPGG